MRVLLTAAGAVAATLATLGLVGSSTATEISDPIGDTFGADGVQHDISSIDAEYGSGNLVVTVNFANDVLPPWTVVGKRTVGSGAPSPGVATNDAAQAPAGAPTPTPAGLPPTGGRIGGDHGDDGDGFRPFVSQSMVVDRVFAAIFLDTDQNANTGAPIADVGAEFTIDLVEVPGQVEVFNQITGVVVGTGSISFTARSFVATVPLALLGNDDGRLNYFVVVGSPDGTPGTGYIALTDEAPNTGVATSETAPTPTPTPAPTAAPTATPAQLPTTGSAHAADPNLPLVVLVAGVLLAVAAAAAATLRWSRT